MPSKLLGEIHVRILRVLYANDGMGCYSKLGDGSDVEDLMSGLIHLRRRKKKRAVEEEKKRCTAASGDGDGLVHNPQS